MNAVEILQEDHQKMLHYFSLIENCGDDKERLDELFKNLEEIIDIHMESK